MANASSFRNAEKRRQDEQRERVGERVARGVVASREGRTGRNSRYLFSGLLKCSECSSNYVMVCARAYACSGYVNGRVCRNDQYVRRDKIERLLLADIEAGLLEPGIGAEIQRRIRQARKARRKDDSARRIAKPEAEVGHLVAAIGEGMRSPALRQRLHAAETEIARVKAAPKPVDVEALLPRIPELIRAQVRELSRLAECEPVRARAAVRQALEAETITLRPSTTGRHLVAEFGLMPVQLATGTVSESVVAGGRFAHSLACHFATA